MQRHGHLHGAGAARRGHLRHHAQRWCHRHRKVRPLPRGLCGLRHLPGRCEAGLGNLSGEEVVETGPLSWQVLVGGWRWRRPIAIPEREDSGPSNYVTGSQREGEAGRTTCGGRTGPLQMQAGAGAPQGRGGHSGCAMQAGHLWGEEWLERLRCSSTFSPACMGSPIASTWHRAGQVGCATCRSYHYYTAVR